MGEEQVKELNPGGRSHETKQPLHEGYIEWLRILGEARFRWQQADKGIGDTGDDRCENQKVQGNIWGVEAKWEFEYWE